MHEDITTIRELREAHGYSRRKTSILVGLSEGELRKVEAGERGLSGASRARYTSAFDLSVGDVRQVAELSPFPVEVPA